MKKVFYYVLLDILKNRMVIIYTLLLSVFCWMAFALENNPTKGLLTLLNLVLLITPLVAMLFSTIYVYNSGEFIELLLSHPLQRTRIWWSLFAGLAGSLVLAFVVGAGIPLLVFVGGTVAVLMLVMGILVTTVFVALAFTVATLSRDKAKGIGMAIMGWLFFSLLFDALVLFLMFQFADYPIEKIMIAITALNPLDLARILLLLQLDVSAMLGYTGAIFRKFFGTPLGMGLAFGLLLLWTAAPFWFSLRRFQAKDL